MYGNASGGMKFLRRISTGSMPSSSAAMSRMRSIEVDRLGAARAAVRGDRRGVRDDGLPVELDLRDRRTRSAAIICVKNGRNAPIAGVRARVGDRAHPQAGDRAVALHARSRRRAPWPRPCHIATMFSERVSVHFTGRPSASAALATSRCSTIMPCLGAEAAADRGVARRGRPRGRGRAASRARRARRADPASARQNVEAAGGLAGHRDDAGRLHRHRRDALVDDALPRRPRRRRRARLRSVRCPCALATFEPCASWTTGAPSARARLRRRRPRAAGRSRRSPPRPRRPPAPSSRRRPSRRCRRRSAHLSRASGGRFIVGGSIMKPCRSGRSRSAAV